MKINNDNLLVDKIDLFISLMLFLVLTIICLICGFCSEVPAALHAETLNQQHVASHSIGYYEYQQFTRLNP